MTVDTQEHAPKIGRPKAFDQEEVLEKAMVLFFRKGYESTSVQDLVDAMGINRFSLYDTFGDKHSLFLQALDRYHRNRRAATLELFADPGPSLAILRRYFENILADARAFKPCGCMIINSAVELARDDPETAAMVTRHFTLLEEMFCTALEVARENGEITTKRDLRAIARFLLNSARGLRIIVTYAVDDQVVEDIVSTTFSVLND